MFGRESRFFVPTATGFKFDGVGPDLLMLLATLVPVSRVEYLIPGYGANCAPLIPLRSYL
jgi:hypothetical protein